MLKTKDLHAEIGGKKILHGCNLAVAKEQVYAIA